MSLFDRFRTIFRANANELADRLEDPASIINQQLLDLDDKLDRAQGALVKEMAEIKLLEQKVRETEEGVRLYQERAEKAVKASNDELARKALEEKNRLSITLTELTRQRDEQSSVVSELRGDLEKLQGLRDEFRRKQSLLSLKQERAKSKDEINAIRAEIDPDHIGREMNRMAEKIDRMDAHAAATKELADEKTKANLDQSFRDLDRTDTPVEDELASLKRNSEPDDVIQNFPPLLPSGSDGRNPFSLHFLCSGVGRGLFPQGDHALSPGKCRSGTERLPEPSSPPADRNRKIPLLHGSFSPSSQRRARCPPVSERRHQNQSFPFIR
ncbi:MAG: PspA/IM30 family protein [Leptospirales bacterium]